LLLILSYRVLLLATELQKYVMCKYRVSCLIMERPTKLLVNGIQRFQDSHHNHRMLSFRWHNSPVQVLCVKHCNLMHSILTLTDSQHLNNGPLFHNKIKYPKGIKIIKFSVRIHRTNTKPKKCVCVCVCVKYTKFILCL
jgi:hypothetical protein